MIEEAYQNSRKLLFSRGHTPNRYISDETAADLKHNAWNFFPGGIGKVILRTLSACSLNFQWVICCWPLFPDEFRSVYIARKSGVLMGFSIVNVAASATIGTGMGNILHNSWGDVFRAEVWQPFDAPLFWQQSVRRWSQEWTTIIGQGQF